MIFNAIIIILLIPLALKGVKFRPLGAAKILQRNVLIYGVGGVIVPFIGIKAIDIVIAATPPRLSNHFAAAPRTPPCFASGHTGNQRRRRGGCIQHSN